MVDQAVLDKLDAGFKRLQDSKDCHSLLKKYLTQDVFESLRPVRQRWAQPFGCHPICVCNQSVIDNRFIDLICYHSFANYLTENSVYLCKDIDWLCGLIEIHYIMNDFYFQRLMNSSLIIRYFLFFDIT